MLYIFFKSRPLQKLCARWWPASKAIVDNNAGGSGLQMELQVVGKDPESVPEADNGRVTTAEDLREELSASKLMTICVK
jgi:hypothetical protein